MRGQEHDVVRPDRPQQQRQHAAHQGHGFPRTGSAGQRNDADICLSKPGLLAVQTDHLTKHVCLHTRKMSSFKIRCRQQLIARLRVWGRCGDEGLWPTAAGKAELISWSPRHQVGVAKLDLDGPVRAGPMDMRDGPAGMYRTGSPWAFLVNGQGVLSCAHGPAAPLPAVPPAKGGASRLVFGLRLWTHGRGLMTIRTWPARVQRAFGANG